MRIFDADVTGSLHVSGSSELKGNLIVSGSQTITGSLTVDGNTKFGDQLSDNHNFTGSVNISGSNTLTGTLIVTNGLSGSLDYSYLINTPTLVSGSSQITYSGLTGIPSNIISGSAQIYSLGFLTGYTDTFTTGSTFNTGDGVITFTKNDGGTYTVDIDGRFLTSYSETDTLSTVTARGASTSTPVTFNGDVTLGNAADLTFVDLAGTFPTSGKGFDWTLNNDGARIYAIQPSSDSIDFVFQLRDNASTNDRFVFHVDDYQGPAFDKYPLIIRGGTEFDLVNSALYINGTLVLSNGRVLQNISGNISMFTNDSGYLTAHPSVSAASSSDNSGRTYIQDILLDSFGHITGITTSTETVVDTNNFTTGATTNGTTGLITFTKNDGGTYTTSISGYVTTQITNLIDSSPSTLDTLNELAAALGDDPNFATTVATSIGNKVSKSGDTMTGNLSIFKNDTTLTLGQINVSTGFTTIEMYAGAGGAFNGYSIRYNKDASFDQLEFIDGSGVPRIFFENGGIINATVIKKIGGLSTQFLKADGSVDTNTYLTAHPSVSAASSSNNSGRTYIQDILLDAFGHITGITTASETVTDTNTFITGATFNTGDGVVTITKNDGNTVTVDLDGRYQLSGSYLTGYTETDTLATVTARGNTTNQAITVSGVTSYNDVVISGGTLTVYESVSGATVFAVDGTNGRLFAVTDDLSNSLFSVNTISGLPVIEAFADYHIVMGRFNQNDFYLGTTGEIGMGLLPVSGYKLAVSGNVRATSFVKSGGTSSQFLKADGSVDSNTYLTSYLNYYTTGVTFNTGDGVLTFTRTDGGTYTVDIDGRFLTSYSETSTLEDVVQRGNTTTISITAASFITQGGNSGQFVKGDGSLDSNTYLTAHPSVSAASSSNNGGRTYIQDILLDSFGHITGITTASETVTDTNYYVTGATFNTGDGVITLTRNDGNTITVDIDGRFLTTHPSVSAASSSDNSGRTYIQDILLDSFGHITGITTGTETVVDTNTNYYVTGATFNTGNGIITITRNDGGTVTVDIDGKYSELGHTHDDRYLPYSKTSDVNKASGWYTIAVNVGNRAVGKFILRDTSSGNHQSVVFYATHHYGNYSDITVLINSRYSGNPFRYIRIVDGSTYDGALLQVYIDDSSSQVQAWVLESIQGSGWIIKDWVDESVDPGDVSNFPAMTETPAQVDLDQTPQGGMIVTGPIYGGGDITQYEYLNTNNYSTTTDTRYYTETEIANFFGGSVAMSGYNKSNWDTAYGWGNHASQGYATTGYVQTQITNLIDAAPSALDTLNELAAALGDDANFSTTIASSIGAKLPLSGGTMTGNIAFGASSGLGLTWGLNTDAAFIKFISTSNAAGGSYLEIGTEDDSNEEIKFTQSGNVRFYLATDGYLKNGAGYKYLYESGTWGIDISGNAATVTNGVYSNGSYSNPSWITALAGSKITGNISGNAYNITQYTINQDLGTSNSPTFNNVTATGVYGTNTSSTRNKYNVYGNSGTYAIGMESGANFGGLADWAMTFQMNNDDDRGFWWGDDAHNTSQGAMALTTNGYLTVARGVRVGYGESDTATPNVPLQVYGSGSLVFDVQGSQGQLFSITDSLSGSLFSVNDISGLPILEVFSDDKLVAGSYGTNAFVVSGTTTTVSGSLAVSGSATVNGGTVWHSNNDGSGSGLDADTLDGYHASSFLTSYSETDTLSSVTARGNTTTTHIGVTTSSPIDFAASGNLGTWIGGIQDATAGWSITNNGIGLKADNNTYAGMVLAGSNGLLYFGRTNASGVGTMSSWLEVNSSGTANFKLSRPQHNGSNLALVSEIPTNLNQLTNGPGYITAHPSVSAASSSNNSGRTYIQDILLDSFGHITGITTATETVVDTDTNYYVTGATFNTSTGVITMTRNDGGTVTVDIDGKYLDSSSYTAADVLSKLLTVDGSGSGLDADLLDGNSSSYFINTSNIGSQSVSYASSAGYSDEAKWINFPDGPRDLSDRNPNWNNRSVAWDFVHAGTADGSGNYAGVMTFSPWDGTSASTGDSSYQLAFANATGVNASGQPKLSIRNGIDSTWNSWYTLIHSGNIGSFTSAHISVSAAGSSNNSGRTYIQDILLDSFGHITGITTATETVVDTDTNYYVTGATFNTSTGVITMTRNDGGTVTVDIDGKYQESGTYLGAITYNDNSNASYQLLWGSGNAVYGTAGVYLNPSTDYVYATSFNASDWFRSSGNTGWYNSTYGGGIYQTESTMVRTYDGRGFWIDGGNTNMVQDATLYVTATNNNDWLAYFNAYNGSKTEYGIYVNIAAGATYGYALRTDGSSFTYRVDGSGRVYAPIYYDINDTAYYLNPASTSNLGTVKLNSTASGTEVFTVDGVNGRLFTITDDLSNSLFSVNTIAGVPVIEAFADNKVIMGRYNQNDFHLNTNGNIAMGALPVSGVKLFVSGKLSIGGANSSYDLYNNGTSYFNGAVTVDDNLTITAGYALYGAHGTWTGEGNKIQWHSTHLYFQNTGGGEFIFRNSVGTNVVTITNAGALTAASLVKSGGTSAQFLMADGSVSTNPGWITSYTDTNNYTTGVTWNGTTAVLTFTRNNGDTYNVTMLESISDVTVTGGTYSAGTLTLTKSNGGTVTVSGFSVVSDTNTYVTGATFNTGNGVITMTRNDGNTVTVDIDGKYAEASHTHNYVTIDGVDRVGVLRFYGEGGDSGFSSGSYPYGIFQEGGVWSSPYPDLKINFHTGIVLAAAASYGGIRFQRDYNDTTELMSVGNGDAHVRVANNLYMGGNLVATQSWVGSQGYLTAHPSVSAAGSSNNSGRTYIQDILLDGYGHITGITTATETVVDTDTNYYVTGATFNTSTGVITMTRNDGGTVTVDIDGKYAESSHTHDDRYFTETESDGRFQPLENQRVSTSSTVRFSNTYSTGWFRNDNSNTGLYNETTTMHLSSQANGYWDVSSTTTVSAIRFYTGAHVSALRGYVYANTSNEIGFLNTGGNWSLRCDNSQNVHVTTAVYAPIYYDSNDNNYYLNPASTSNLKTVKVNSTVAGTDALTVDGVNGRLFTITDDMTDSIFSVNTISGLPVIEAFADYKVVMGRYNQNDFIINSSGQVSIGSTAQASYKFTVIGGQWGSYFKGGDTGTGSDIARFVDTNSNTKLLVRGDGNLYIYGTGYINDNVIYHAGNIPTWNQNTSGNAATATYATTAGALTSMNISQFTNNSGYIAAGSTVSEVAAQVNATRFKSAGDISQAAGNHSLQIFADVNNDAFMAFHISNDYAINFGLDDSTNRLYVGGWSDGTGTKYQMWDSRDFSSTNVSNWNTAYGWGNHASAGYITSYSETDTLGSVTNRGNSTSQNLVFSNGRKGLIGVYDAAQTQAIFAMGAAYILTDGGASATIGNLYGLAWSYNPDHGGAGNNPQSKAGLEHQLLLMNNGVTLTALGAGIWTSGLITTTSYGTSSNWNTAYGWGNHASAGYQSASTAITTSNIGSQSVSYATTAGSAPNASNLNASYGVTAGAGNGLKFWGGSDGYKIHMGNSAEYHYGPVTDYSIKTNIDSNGATRGFTWGTDGGTPIAALNVGNGNMQIAGTFTASNFSGSSSGTNTGDQTNISGNAATVTINYNNDSNSTYQLLWGSGNSVYGTGGVYVNPSLDYVYATAFVSSKFGIQDGTPMDCYMEVGDGNPTEDGIGYGGTFHFYGDQSVASSHLYFGGAYVTNNFVVGGRITENSSIRYKKDVETLEGGLDKVLAMRGVTYIKKDTGIKEVGLIAEELVEILPEVVGFDTQGQPDSVSYSRITAILIEAIKDLKKEIDELKGKK